MKIRSLKAARGRRGFTLIEIMVVMTIIAILISILVPAIGYVRETARGTQCRASLRQFFIGFTGLAERDKSEKMSSGAFDPTRDGCPDTIGWVADLVNSKVCKPIELRCPSNPGVGSEKYLDILGSSTSGTGGEDASTAKQRLGSCSAGTLVAADLANQFLAKGYGTNHMTTWFMSRSAPKLNNTAGTGATTSTIFTVGIGTQKGLAGSRGPLTRRMLDQSPVTANTIPLAGDSNLGDIKERFMESDIVGSDGQIYVKNGDLLVESFSDGVYQRNPMAKAVDFQVLTQSSATSSGLIIDEQPRKGQPKKQNLERSHLQDYRDFGPVHGGSANVLFADGSVKAFSDSNGDGFLNPGFLSDDVAKWGYAVGDSNVELPEAEIFSGIFLEPIGSNPKANLD